MIVIKKPIILDLDETLILASYQELDGLPMVAKRRYHYLYHRPGLNQFLKYLEKRKHDIIFYTSAKADYARWVIKTLPLEGSYPLYTRKYTLRKETEFGEEYIKSVESVKELSEFRGIIPVLDDKPQLWLPNDQISFMEIDAWMGDPEDHQLPNLISSSIKSSLGRISKA